MKINRIHGIVFVILSLVFLLIAILAYRQIMSWRQQDEFKLAQGLPLHDCAAGEFVQYLSPGEKISFRVRLEASRFWRGHRVILGDLPRGVSGEVAKAEGRGGGEAVIRLAADPDARPADYSLVLIYEESRGGDPARAFCQYNLIIR